MRQKPEGENHAIQTKKPREASSGSVAQRQSSGLLHHRAGVRVPSGPYAVIVLVAGHPLGKGKTRVRFSVTAPSSCPCSSVGSSSRLVSGRSPVQIWAQAPVRGSRFADIAQLVEQLFRKQKVPSSTLGVGSKAGFSSVSWRSSVGRTVGS